MITKVKELFSQDAKEIKRLTKLVEKVNKKESVYANYSDEQLQKMTEVFKDQLASGKTIDDIKIDAFAVVREAAKRTIGLRHFDVQLIGGFVLLEGSIAQMYTGEGKTLVATLPSYLKALEGKGVHIVTANEYLARRDKELMGQIHEFLGLKVGLNISQMEPDEKKIAYNADITYGTGTEFGFDYLRDNMVFRLEDKVQRPLYYCIIDEIDSILIDEARTPLIIASKSSEGDELFNITASIMKTFKEGVDFEVDLETRQTFLTDEGANKIEAAFGIDNLYDAEHQELFHVVLQSLRAHAIMKKDVDYIVKDGKILIIDKFTGRILEGRTFSDGLHQAIEAKEGVEITEENSTQATITVQNYFRMYKTISGMTGSAMPAKKEFWETYGMNVVAIPTNKPVQRIDYEDLIYIDYESKVKRIVQEVKRIHEQGRPILIGTTSVEQSERLATYLKKEKIKHLLLNAKTEEDEARMIAMAGQKNQVMLATNMAGRGTDIILGEGVKELGGLHIIGTERHESYRIDMQLRGRSGRQGDPGSSQFIISLEDDLFKYYDEEEKERYMKKVKTDEEGKVISPEPVKFVKKVQETVENMFYSGRMYILKLDNVLDQHRKIIYSMRDRILGLTPTEMFAELLDYMKNYVERIVDIHCPQDGKEWNYKGLIKDLSRVFVQLDWTPEWLEDLSITQIKEMTLKEYEQLKELILQMEDDENLGNQLKRFALQQIDTNWLHHLDTMNEIRDSINYSGYAQEDPFRVYEKAALEAFNYVMYDIQSGITLRFMEYVKSKFNLEPLSDLKEDEE